jgi:hypothetical protein
VLHGLDRHVGPLHAGDADDRDARVEAADLLVRLQPGRPGQAQVEDDDLGGMGADVPEAFVTGAGDLLGPSSFIP